MNRGTILVGSLMFTAAAGPQAVNIDRKTAALDFRYHWPAEAAAISPLDWKLRTQMTKDYRAAIAAADEDQAAAREQKRPYYRDFYWMEWSVAGETPRLLSLRSQLSSFTGGAHPNTSYSVLLWDRRRSKPISVNDLLTAQTSVTALMRPAYCKALDAERRKRRMGETMGGVFDQCPKFGDLSIVPSDQNRRGRFDTIDFIASPYVAGPYVEGKYEISLPVTPNLIAGLKVEYRASFEVHRQ